MTTTTTDPFKTLPDPIAAALTARGFTELTPVQRAVVAAESTGRDLRISSQTGSGKTVAIGIALASHFIDRLSRSAADKKTESKDRIYFHLVVLLFVVQLYLMLEFL